MNGFIMTNDRTRKNEIRERMALTGEPYSVAARNLNLPPSLKQIFLQGYGNPQAEMKSWMVPFQYALIEKAPYNDYEAIKNLGKAFRKLDDEGNYFCNFHYILKTLRDFCFGLTLMPRKTNEEISEKWEQFSRNNKYSTVASIYPELQEASDKRELDTWKLVEILHATFTEDVSHSKDTQAYSYNSILLLPFFFSIVQEQVNAAMIWKLTETLNNMPPLEEVNTDDIRYNQWHRVPPVPRVVMKKGDVVRFRDNRRVWTVAGASANFAVLLNSSEDYTVIDWNQNIRGTVNSWGYSADTEQNIVKMLEALEVGHEAGPLKPGLRLGRNQVALRIKSVLEK